MRIAKTSKDGVGPDVLNLVSPYPTKAEVTGGNQALLGLKNLLLALSRGFATVDVFTPVENIRAVGVDYVQKVAQHIHLHGIKFSQVESTFRELVAAKKTALDEHRLQLALDLLISAVRQIQSGYNTNR